MRLLPIVAATAIGMFATAAFAQSTTTQDPNSAPGASATGGKPARVSPGEVKKDNTMDPNSAPGASAAGKGKVGTAANDPAAKANTTDPNSATTGVGGHKKSKKKKSSM